MPGAGAGAPQRGMCYPANSQYLGGRSAPLPAGPGPGQAPRGKAVLFCSIGLPPREGRIEHSSSALSWSAEGWPASPRPIGSSCSRNRADPMNEDSLLETVYRAWIATEPHTTEGKRRTHESFVAQYERMRQIEPSLAEMSDDEIGQLLDLLAEGRGAGSRAAASRFCTAERGKHGRRRRRQGRERR